MTSHHYLASRLPVAEQLCFAAVGLVNQFLERQRRRQYGYKNNYQYDKFFHWDTPVNVTVPEYILVKNKRKNQHI